MKKYYLIIMMILALACLVIPAVAADPSVSVSTPDAINPGEEFTVTVIANSDIYFGAAYACPVFDEDMFTLVSGEWLIDGVISDFDAELGDGVILLGEKIVANGALCTFTLRAKKNISAQNTTIGCRFIVSDSADALVEFIGSSAPNVDINASKGSIVGQITSYNPQNEVEIKLVQNGETVYTAKITAENGTDAKTQQFEILGVAPGTYDLVITKTGHLKFTITGITVSTDEIDLREHDNDKIASIVLGAGDINNDGCVDLKDVVELTSDLVYGKSYEDTDRKYADVNGDKCFDLKDLVIITSDANYGKSAIEMAY